MLPLIIAVAASSNGVDVDSVLSTMQSVNSYFQLATPTPNNDWTGGYVSHTAGTTGLIYSTHLYYTPTRAAISTHSTVCMLPQIPCISKQVHSLPKVSAAHDCIDDYKNNILHRVYMTGNMAHYHTSGNETVLQYAVDWGDAHSWKLTGYRGCHGDQGCPDNIAAGFSYVEIYEEKATKNATLLAAITRAVETAILHSPCSIYTNSSQAHDSDHCWWFVAKHLYSLFFPFFLFFFLPKKKPPLYVVYCTTNCITTRLSILKCTDDATPSSDDQSHTQPSLKVVGRIIYGTPNVCKSG